MTFETAKLTSQATSLSNSRYWKYFAVSTFYHLFILILVFIQQEGGIYHGGIGEFFGKFYKSGYIVETDSAMGSILTRPTSLTLIAVILTFLIVFYRASIIFRRFTLIPTLIYAISTTLLWQQATSNFLVMYMNMFYLSSLFFYWMKYGELLSFFENRLILFTFKRSLAIIPLFIAISLFTFVGTNYIGDPIAIATANIKYGRDKVIATLLLQFGLVDGSGNRLPIWRRYLTWIYEFIHGNLGNSYVNGNPVTENISLYMWETLKMQVLALIIAFALSLVVGILAAYYHRTPLDSAVSAFALLGLSMPIFVSGLLSIMIFGGLGLNWFPNAGAHGLGFTLAAQCESCYLKPEEYFSQNFSNNWASISFWTTLLQIWWVYTKDSLMHLALPVLTLTFASMATFSRLTRSTMLEVMRQDYILAARANGLSEFTVVGKHALRNVILPLVTFVGISIGFLLAGAPITETIFTWPGLGQYFLRALGGLDIPVLMALTMIITIMILFANLIVDVAYTFIDPRITL